MKLRYHNGEKELIKGHGSGEFCYHFPKILLYFHLTLLPFSLSQCYSVTFVVKRSSTFANLPNTTLSITAPFMISKSVEQYTQLNMAVKVWPALSLAASKKYTTRTTFKHHVDCEHGDHCSLSPWNKGEKRASSDNMESEMKSLKKVKSVGSKDDSLFQSMFMILYFF